MAGDGGGRRLGIGRAIPIVVLAPLAGSSRGIRVTEWMCERDGAYRGVRRGDAVALMLAGIALIVAPGSAGAAGTDVPHATDPAAKADALLFQRLGGPAVISRGGQEIALPGNHPAIGGRYIATVAGNRIRLLDRNSLAPIAEIDAPGADAVAVSDTWLAYRAPTGAGDGIFIRYIANPASPGPPAQLAAEGGASQVSPPAVDGSILLYAIATPRGSRVVQWVMGTHKHRALVRSRMPAPLRSRRPRQLLRLRADELPGKPADGPGPPPARHRSRPGQPETLCGPALVECTDRFRRRRDRARAQGEQHRRHHHRSEPQTPEAPTRGAAPRGREQPVLIP